MPNEPVDHRYDNPDKIFVTVDARFHEGEVTPLVLHWIDGRKYRISRILDVRQKASTKAGGYGWRYEIEVDGKCSFLWFDDFDSRWYVERK